MQEIYEKVITELKQKIEDKDQIIERLRKLLMRQNLELRHLRIDREWQKGAFLGIDGNIAKD